MNHERPRHDPFSPWRSLLVALIVATLLVGSILAMRVVLIAGSAVTGSVLMLPICFTLVTVVTEVYGPRAGQRAVWTAAFASLLAMASFAVTAALPTAYDWPTSGEVEAVFAETSRFLVGGAVAFVLGETAVLWYLARRPRQHLWVRVAGAPIAAQALGGAVVVVIDYGFQLPLAALVVLTMNRVVFALAAASALAPFCFLAIEGLRQRERKELGPALETSGAVVASEEGVSCER